MLWFKVWDLELEAQLLIELWTRLRVLELCNMSGLTMKVLLLPQWPNQLLRQWLPRWPLCLLPLHSWTRARMPRFDSSNA